MHEATRVETRLSLRDDKGIFIESKPVDRLVKGRDAKESLAKVLDQANDDNTKI